MPYFDYNATTPLLASAREAWLRSAAEAWHNPSSLYRSAARARNLLEDYRLRLGERLDCDPKRLAFNSGTTEGVNSIFAYIASASATRTLPVLLSPVEHPCVLAAAERHFSGRVDQMPLEPDGRVSLERAEEKIKSRRYGLVCLMAANNETGVLQPWQEMAEVCRSAGVLFLCDASQWAGKLPLAGMGRAGFLTASAHKFGGPKGVGFLAAPAAAAGFHGQAGGEQEQGMRGGTEDLAGIAAMMAALEEAEAQLGLGNELAARLYWREEFEEELLERLPGARVAGRGSDRLWNTVSIVLPIGSNDRWVRKLDRKGFEVSTGSACSSGKEAPSHVLSAIGFSADEARRAIRASSGWEGTRADWKDLAEALSEIYREISDEGGGDGEDLTEVIQL